MTVKTVVDNTEREATTTDLEIIGMRFGIQCAQRVLRGYATDPDARGPSAIAVLLHFQRLVNDYVISQRTTNGMTDAGDVAYRKGFERGVSAQIRNPEAIIEIKVT